MRVAAQRQAEMPLIGGRIIGLGLGAQHLLHHLRAEIRLADPIQDMVERRRPDHLAQREGDAIGLQIILQRGQLLARGRFVDAVHDRGLLRLQRLGGGDVGGDHVILDQPVRIEPRTRRDREDAPLLIQHHPSFGQVEVERLARIPRLGQRPPAVPGGRSALSTSPMSQSAVPVPSIAACASS